MKRLAEYFEDEHTHRFSWEQTGKGFGVVGGTIAFLKITWNTQPSEASAWLFLVFIGALVVPGLLAKAIGLKWGGGTNGNGTATNENGTGVKPPLV